MDGCDDGASARCQAVQCVDERQGGGGVQPRGGLVQKDDGRVDEHLVAHADPLALAAGYAPPHEAADDGIATLVQSQGLNNALHPCLLLLPGGLGTTE
eukprot:scaffold258803_cov34-Prasinocladus_malaysianus.AAC.1